MQYARELLWRLQYENNRDLFDGVGLVRRKGYENRWTRMIRHLSLYCKKKKPQIQQVGGFFTCLLKSVHQVAARITRACLQANSWPLLYQGFPAGEGYTGNRHSQFQVGLRSRRHI